MTSIVQSVLLTAGKALVNGALSGYTRWAPAQFQLGSGFNYTPAASDTVPNGTIVYTGSAALITARAIDENTVRYQMVVPEGAGPFTFGSVVLSGVGFDGSILPFVEISLPFALNKIVADPNINNSNPFPKPGDRIIISVTLTHYYDDGTATVTVNITSPSFANLPYYADESGVPPPISQPWNQFVLNNHTALGSPALVTKRSDSTYWAMPHFKNLRHPEFDVLSGGKTGDGFQTEQNSWAWGQRYTTDPSLFNGQIGGYGYTEFSSYSSNVIGGSSY